MLDFGSVRDLDISVRLGQANDDPIVRAIAYLGPVFLKEVLLQVAPKLAFPRHSGSVCEVCRSIVKNPAAVEALRRNANLFVPATNAVANRLEDHAA